MDVFPRNLSKQAQATLFTSVPWASRHIAPQKHFHGDLQINKGEAYWRRFRPSSVSQKQQKTQEKGRLLGGPVSKGDF
jgi:hypothetical protein